MNYYSYTSKAELKSIDKIIADKNSISMLNYSTITRRYDKYISSLSQNEILKYLIISIIYSIGLIFLIIFFIILIRFLILLRYNYLNKQTN